MEVSRSNANQRTEALQAQRKTEQRDQAERQQQQAADEARARERAKENRPVVNTQGQTTGRLLNVTA